MVFWFRIGLTKYFALFESQSLTQNLCYRRNKSPDSDSAWEPHPCVWRGPRAGEVQLFLFWESHALLVRPVPQTAPPVTPETHLKREHPGFHCWAQPGWGILPSEKNPRLRRKTQLCITVLWVTQYLASQEKQSANPLQKAFPCSLFDHRGALSL